jgi:class 3 adenylate cyclase
LVATAVATSTRLAVMTGSQEKSDGGLSARHLPRYTQPTMRRWQSAGQRDLRTVLFSDLVGSTEEAARLGDRAWAAILARHHSLVRAALRRSDGHEEDTAGDGFFVTFARPTDALACAAEIEREVAALGLAVRVGVHAGEVEHQDGKATGITVHAAARLMAAAGAGEVLVSATVRELTAGAGWSFADRGLLELKGLTEPVHAYALDLGADTALAPAGRRSRFVVGPLPAFLAAAVLVVVALLAVRLAGGSAGPAASPSPVALGSTLPASLASLGAAVSPGASPSPDAVPFAVSESELTPGYYVANTLSGSPTLTIADPGWRVTYPGLVLVRQTSAEDQLTFDNVPSLATDPCGFKPGIDLGDNPETQFVAWAQANRGLKLSPSTGRLKQFGNLTTTEFDVSLVDKYACSLTSSTSVAIQDGPGGLSLTQGLRVRIEVASAQGQFLLIIISTPSEADFDAFDALAEKLLSTLNFPP